MRHPYLTFAIVLTSTAAAGVALIAQDRVDLAMVARIRAEATERSKVLETFNYITNVTGARPTGQPRAQAGRRLRARASSPSGAWRTRASSRLSSAAAGSCEKFSLELTAPRYFPMFGYPLAWTPSTKGVLDRRADLPRRQDRSRDHGARREAARRDHPRVAAADRVPAHRSPAAGRHRSAGPHRRTGAADGAAGDVGHAGQRHDDAAAEVRRRRDSASGHRAARHAHRRRQSGDARRTPSRP